MNCLLCKGGPLIMNHSRHEAFCPQCGVVTTELLMAQRKQGSLDSGRDKLMLFGGARRAGKQISTGAIVAKVWEKMVGQQMDNISSSGCFRDYTVTDELSNGHQSVMITSDTKVIKDLLMAELEKKLTLGKS